jgi:histidine triad (HIT) family protein
MDTQLRRLDHPERKWDRVSDYFLRVLDGEKTVHKIYENDWALAFHDIGDHNDMRWETNVVVITKRQIQCILDLGIADDQVWLGLLDCIQNTAKRLGLDETGFTMKINVLPPYQDTPRIHMHMLAGEKDQKGAKPQKHDKQSAGAGQSAASDGKAKKATAGAHRSS